MGSVHAMRASDVTAVNSDPGKGGSGVTDMSTNENRETSSLIRAVIGWPAKATSMNPTTTSPRSFACTRPKLSTVNGEPGLAFINTRESL